MLDNLKRSNQGHITFKWLHLMSGSSYDQSLFAMHILRPI